MAELYTQIPNEQLSIRAILSEKCCFTLPGVQSAAYLLENTR
ncbi:hypothetical protein PALB_15360 [Pseudoalteromonas luteoviolacea B = ATCC 29581]|nr:hypothetical protein PALB_15360 [Pseudoalteromonas luteoviolacea B = ATCC 29581]